MAEHYLTVCQFKKLYLKASDSTFCIISDPLHPDDAIEFGFVPLISVMLTVAHHKIYYQEIFLKNEPICLINFLARAWSKNKVGGLPGVLTVSPALESFYGMESALRSIDPENTISFNVSTNKSISASLRTAQEIHIHWLDIDDRKLPPGQPVNELLKWANQQIFHDGLFFEGQIPVTDGRLDPDLIERALSITRPQYFDGFAASSWIDASARKAERLTPEHELRYSDADYHCANYYKLVRVKGAPLLQGQTPSEPPFQEHGYGWYDAHDLCDILNTLDCMSVDYQREIEPAFPKEKLDGIRKYGETIPEDQMDVLYDRILRSAGIFFPKSAYQYNCVISVLDGLEPVMIAELTAKGSESWPYRVVGVLDRDLDTHLIAIDTKYRFKVERNSDFYGKIDVSAPCMAGIMHSLKDVKSRPSQAMARFYSDIIGSMLKEVDEWPKTYPDVW